MDVILNADQISTAISKLSDLVIESTPSDFEIAVIGIKSRGEVIAQRICNQISDKISKPVDCGSLDITLYRDDINEPHGNEQPQVRGTEITFNIDHKIIILVDDVLYTGRSVRAAMDALVDLGRPEAIRLAVLVDRSGREFPIQADWASTRIDVADEKSVEVHLVETDETDQVIVE